MESSPLMLTAEHTQGFVEGFLLERFYERQPISPLHVAYWRLVCDPYPYVAFAGPRGSAKSTAVNHAWGLAVALFGEHPFQLKVSKTYNLACERIWAAKQELRENDKVRFAFNVKLPFIRDREDDFVCRLGPSQIHPNGYQFRMAAMGMDQAKRGWSWGTMRPTMIQVDDGEDDIEVLNPDTRDRTILTIEQVLIPMMGERKCIRVYGTILHQASMLAKLLLHPSWKSARFQICDENVSEASLLWPQRFPRKELLTIKQMYAASNRMDVFNREYRNIAIDTETSFFRPEDFRPMTEEDDKKPKTYYVGGDLAYSKKEKRDFTVFYVGGLDDEGILHIVDERRGRWDGKEVIDEMYRINEAWSPVEWFIESGAIMETLGAALDLRMAGEGYLNLCPGLIPTKDKAMRATPIQARMRSRGVRFDTESSWFADAKQELLEFSQEGTRGEHDDRVDALAWLGQGIRRMSAPESEIDIERREVAAIRKRAALVDPLSFGATGYEYYRQQTGLR